MQSDFERGIYKVKGIFFMKLAYKVIISYVNLLMLIIIYCLLQILTSLWQYFN